MAEYTGFRRGTGQSYRQNRTTYKGNLGELNKLRRELGKFPKDLTAALRPRLRESAKEPLQEVRRKASWSHRIPNATRISVTFTKRFTGVSIVTDRKKARHARPYENRGRDGSFKHRVFGRKWVYQKARPFMRPGAETWFSSIDEEIGKAIDEVIKPYGFK